MAFLDLVGINFSYLEFLHSFAGIGNRKVMAWEKNKASVNDIHVSDQDFPSMPCARAVFIIHYAIKKIDF